MPSPVRSPEARVRTGEVLTSVMISSEPRAARGEHGSQAGPPPGLDPAPLRTQERVLGGLLPITPSFALSV